MNEDIEKLIAQRHHTHGDAHHVFSAIAQAWNDHLKGRDITPVDVCVMMARLKHIRAAFGDVFHADHMVDAEGYLKLAKMLDDSDA